MIMAAGPPLAAILLALGTLGWLDFRLNMFLNVMTPLIMVISFSDSMQLTFAVRDRLLAGKGKVEAIREALLVVGPACVLTHATAGLSFVALQFSNSDLIRTFGEAGLISTLIALLAILLLTPVLGVFFLSRRSGARRQDQPRRFRRLDAAALLRLRRGPHDRAGLGLYSLIALLPSSRASASITRRSSRATGLADQVPDKRQAVAASGRLDAKLTGANPIDVLIEFPPGASLYDAQTLDVIAAVHSTLSRTPGVGNVWSLETLRRWLAEKAHSNDVALLEADLPEIPARPSQAALYRRARGCGHRRRPCSRRRCEPVAADRGEDRPCAGADTRRASRL